MSLAFSSPPLIAAPRQLGLGANVPWALAALAYAALVRFPFLLVDGGDEPFFSEVARQWLEGRIPYVATFDVKPPGIFALVALVDWLFGATLGSLKGMEIVCDAIVCLCLALLGQRIGRTAIGVWAGVCYVPLSVSVINIVTYPPLVALTTLAFTLFIFADGRRAKLFFAGLAMGCACTIKQVAATEAIALLAAWRLTSADPRRDARQAAWLIAGMAIPPLAFLAYFAAKGAALEMIDAVVLAAFVRGGGAEGEPGFFGGLLRFLPMQKPLVAVTALTVVAFIRRRIMMAGLPNLPFVALTAWLIGASLEVLAQRAIDEVYFGTMLPPALLLSCACVEVALTELARIGAGVRQAIFAAICAFTGFAMSWEDMHRYQESATLREMKQAIAALSPKREDRLLAVNRANWLYTMTGLHAPTRVFHPQHLMCPFPAAAGNPFAANMAQKPRFIVIAEGGGAMVCELKDAWRDVRAAIAADYVERARVRGHSEEQVLYERKP